MDVDLKSLFAASGMRAEISSGKACCIEEGASAALQDLVGFGGGVRDRARDDED